MGSNLSKLEPVPDAAVLWDSYHESEGIYMWIPLDMLHCTAGHNDTNGAMQREFAKILATPWEELCLRHDITAYWQQSLAAVVMMSFAMGKCPHFSEHKWHGVIMWTLDEDCKRPWRSLKFIVEEFAEMPGFPEYWTQVLQLPPEQCKAQVQLFLGSNVLSLQTKKFQATLKRSERSMRAMCWGSFCRRACKDGESFKTCNRCCIARYCSERCQRDDYLSHKDWCKAHSDA
jgi:hypothetical protein